MIAVLKHAIAIYGKDLEWTTVRPAPSRTHDTAGKLACRRIESDRVRDGRLRSKVSSSSRARTPRACDIADPEGLHHNKDTLKSSHVVTSRTDAECWAAIRSLLPDAVAVYVSITVAKNNLSFKQT